MRSLNLDQLRTLIEVIELGSFSAAARRLNITQPAVSQQIRELERRFDVRLIERMGKQAHATVPGRDLVEAARRIFHDCDLAEAAMRRFRDGWIGRVRIGTTNTAMTYLLPPILRRLRLDHPGVDLLVTNLPTRESVEHIFENKLDLALVTLPVEKTKLRITPLCPHRLVAILPAGTPDVPDEVTPDYVARQTFLLEHARGAVHTLVMRWLSGHVPLSRTPMHLATIEGLKTAVESNLGMSIVPDVAVAPSRNIIVRPLRPPVASTLALIEHRNKPSEPALEIVRNALLALRTDGKTEPATAQRRAPNPEAQGRSRRSRPTSGLRRTKPGTRAPRTLP
jgi:DNA-binding transcriptional LysR family regulator